MRGAEGDLDRALELGDARSSTLGARHPGVRPRRPLPPSRRRPVLDRELRADRRAGAADRGRSRATSRARRRCCAAAVSRRWAWRGSGATRRRSRSGTTCSSSPREIGRSPRGRAQLLRARVPRAVRHREARRRSEEALELSLADTFGMPTAVRALRPPVHAAARGRRRRRPGHLAQALGGRRGRDGLDDLADLRAGSRTRAPRSRSSQSLRSPRSNGRSTRSQSRDARTDASTRHARSPRSGRPTRALGVGTRRWPRCGPRLRSRRTSSERLRAGVRPPRSVAPPTSSATTTRRPRRMQRRGG